MSRLLEVTILLLKVIIVVILVGPFLLLYNPPTGIHGETQRIVHFERNQERLEAVIHESLAAGISEVNRRAWWQNIFDSPPQEDKTLYRTMRRAKVREVEVYNSDEGVKVNLLTGIRDKIPGATYFGYSWINSKDALEIPEDFYIISSSRKELGDGWFLYDYEYDPF